jgi:hypothetical protein
MPARLKLTVEVHARLEREARIRAQITSYKQLSRETGLSYRYINVVVGRMIRAMSCKDNDSRGTGAGENQVNGSTSQSAP